MFSRLSFRECLSKFVFVGMDQTPDRSWGLNGLGWETAGGNSSGFHAPGAYALVPYVWANVTDEETSNARKVKVAFTSVYAWGRSSGSFCLGFTFPDSAGCHFRLPVRPAQLFSGAIRRLPHCLRDSLPLAFRVGLRIGRGAIYCPIDLGCSTVEHQRVGCSKWNTQVIPVSGTGMGNT